MSRRYYANKAPQLTLAANITAGATSCTVAGSFSGWPSSYPFFAALEKDAAGFEIVSVTNVVGAVATIARGQDGTTGLSHLAGATLDFVVVAKDLDEANAHVNASSGVHGLAGSVVGDTDTQTLTNKTITNPVMKVGSVFIGEAFKGITGGFAVVGTKYALGAPITFTLAAQRRVRVRLEATINVPTVAGSYSVLIGRSAGASFNAATATYDDAVGAPVKINGTYAEYVSMERTMLLAAGTYTVDGAGVRSAGGSATDAFLTGYLQVTDLLTDV